MVRHLRADKAGGTTGMRQTMQLRVLAWEKPQNLWLKKPMGVVVVGETPSLTGEFIGETHRVLECTQTHTPTQESAPEGPNLLGSRGEVTESQQRAQQEALFPL